MIDWEQYEDEYEDWYDQPQGKKITKMKKSNEDVKKKEKKTRRVTKQDLWDEYLENEQEEDFGKNMMKEIKKTSPSIEKPKYDKPKTQNQSQTQEKKFTPRGVNVHTIKNVQIDFDGVADIQKIESVYNNKNTYGIKFIFKSKNNTFRVIWFNQNMRERDSVYNTEFAYWKNLDK